MTLAIKVSKSGEILLEVCEGFLKRVNNDRKLRPYLVEYPYNGTNIDIMILFVDPTNNWVMPPYIALAANFQGEVYYRTTNIGRKLVHLHKETYEEALKIVKDNQN